MSNASGAGIAGGRGGTGVEGRSGESREGCGIGIGGSALDSVVVAYLAYVAALESGSAGSEVRTLAGFVGLREGDSLLVTDGCGVRLGISCGPGVGEAGGDTVGDGCDVDVGVGSGSVRTAVVGGGGGGEAPLSERGPNYVRNKVSRDKKKAKKKRERMMTSDSWRPESQATVRPVSRATVRPFESSPLPSLTGTVQTVTTELAEELEAKRTLASRRAAENRVAEALANHKLQSMLDPDKTKAVASLDAARVEQRINEAKAKAQAAFLKCSDAVTSLGSAGSAGEYVLKKEVKKGQIYQKKYEDAQEQMQRMLKYLPNEAKAELAAWPPVKIPTYGEMFGDCPASYNDDEAEAYYRDLENLDEEHIFRGEVLA